MQTRRKVFRVRKTRYDDIIALLTSRLQFNNMHLLEEVAKSVSEKITSPGSVQALIFAGPSFTGKTRTLDTVLSSLQLLRIINPDKQNERKIYSQNLVHCNGSDYGNRFNRKDKEALFLKIKNKLLEDDPLGIFIVIDEMDNGGKLFVDSVIGELLDDLSSWKKTKQFVTVLMATNTGGEELTEWCNQNEFDYMEAQDVIQEVFKRNLHFKIFSRLPKIIPFPPYGINKIGDVIKTIIYKYLRNHILETTELDVSKTVHEPALWKYDSLSGLRPVKTVIEDTLDRLIGSLFINVNSLPDYMSLGFGPIAGKLGFWSRDNHPIGDRVTMFRVSEHLVRAAYNSVDTLDFENNNRIVPDLSSISSKFNIVPVLSNHMESRLSNAVVPLKSTYDPINTDIIVRDSSANINGKGNIVCSVSLVQLIWEKFIQVDRRIGTHENKIETNKNKIVVLESVINELKSKVEYINPVENTNQHNVGRSRVNRVYEENKSNRYLLCYWDENVKRRLPYGFKKYGGKKRTREAIDVFCSKHNIALTQHKQ